MIPLSKIKFNELKEYLYENKVYGLFAQRRKHIIIYTFERYYNSTKKIVLKVKVMRKTKYVMSAFSNGTTYTDYDELKKFIER